MSKFSSISYIKVTKHRGAQKRAAGLDGDQIVYGGYSVWQFLPIALLALRILRWLLDFWKICSRLFYIIHICRYFYIFKYLQRLALLKAETCS